MTKLILWQSYEPMSMKGEQVEIVTRGYRYRGILSYLGPVPDGNGGDGSSVRPAGKTRRIDKSVKL